MSTSEEEKEAWEEWVTLQAQKQQDEAKSKTKKDSKKDDASSSASKDAPTNLAEIEKQGRFYDPQFKLTEAEKVTFDPLCNAKTKDEWFQRQVQKAASLSGRPKIVTIFLNETKEATHVQDLEDDEGLSSFSAKCATGLWSIIKDGN